MAGVTRVYPPLDFWLVVNADMDVLTVDGATPAVFSGEGEAEMFLRFEANGAAVVEGWMVRQTSPGELISTLYCRCADAREVCVDPLPGVLSVLLAPLGRTSRSRFAEWVVGRVAHHQ